MEPIEERSIEVIFYASNAEWTKALYEELLELGPLGRCAVNLLRAQKASSRAKLYRGRRFKDAAYDRKSWSMQQLCQCLQTEASALGIVFGWKVDPTEEWAPWVLYVDLPEGQVSFHSLTRGEGPDYAGEWDGARLSENRILTFATNVRTRAHIVAARPQEEQHVVCQYQAETEAGEDS